MEPITFTPLYMERVWGGRELDKAYGRKLPETETPIGESWEMVDREDVQSVVDHGEWAGTKLNALWTQQRSNLFGDYLHDGRFPILMKILDAREALSIQVHPPADIAKELGGEKKTEMWFIADCDPSATLYVGLKRGVSRQSFQQAIQDGTVADCVHEIKTHPGESIFIPSGRLHAIGAGFLIHEIQQNSDTTYRVFDWNRLGLDGESRELHVEPSLASIDFEDIEPSMTTTGQDTLADCPYFKVRKIQMSPGMQLQNPQSDRFSIVSIIAGSLKSIGGRAFNHGQCLLMPKGAAPLIATENCSVLQVTMP